jgi:hypothetical protein
MSGFIVKVLERYYDNKDQIQDHAVVVLTCAHISGCLEEPDVPCSDNEPLRAAMAISSYRLVDKYMRHPRPLGPGVRLSSEHISRVWTIHKVK